MTSVTHSVGKIWPKSESYLWRDSGNWVVTGRGGGWFSLITKKKEQRPGDAAISPLSLGAVPETTGIAHKPWCLVHTQETENLGRRGASSQHITHLLLLQVKKTSRVCSIYRHSQKNAVCVMWPLKVTCHSFSEQRCHNLFFTSLFHFITFFCSVLGVDIFYEDGRISHLNCQIGSGLCVFKVWITSASLQECKPARR